MNMNALVLAADSAATVAEWVGGKFERRYFKGTNKIFQLSNHQPVGAMIYGDADLEGMPWELLIKNFRSTSVHRVSRRLKSTSTDSSNTSRTIAIVFPIQ
jgi:hypothetical protein